MVRRFPVTLGSDGVLSLVFAATVDLATVSGIEVGVLHSVVRCCTHDILSDNAALK